MAHDFNSHSGEACFPYCPFQMYYIINILKIAIFFKDLPLQYMRGGLQVIHNNYNHLKGTLTEIFSLNQPGGQFSPVVAMSMVRVSVCLSVPLRLLGKNAQTIRVLVFFS